MFAEKNTIQVVKECLKPLHLKKSLALFCSFHQSLGVYFSLPVPLGVCEHWFLHLLRTDSGENPRGDQQTLIILLVLGF